MRHIRNRRAIKPGFEKLEHRAVMDGDGYTIYASISASGGNDDVSSSDNVFYADSSIPYISDNSPSLVTAVNVVVPFSVNLVKSDYHNKSKSWLKQDIAYLDAQISKAQAKLDQETHFSELNRDAYAKGLSQEQALVAKGASLDLVPSTDRSRHDSQMSSTLNDAVNNYARLAANDEAKAQGYIASAYAHKKNGLDVLYYQAMTRVSRLDELGQLWSARHADRKQFAYVVDWLNYTNSQLQVQVDVRSWRVQLDGNLTIQPEIGDAMRPGGSVFLNWVKPVLNASVWASAILPGDTTLPVDPGPNAQSEAIEAAADTLEKLVGSYLTTSTFKTIMSQRVKQVADTVPTGRQVAGWWVLTYKDGAKEHGDYTFAATFYPDGPPAPSFLTLAQTPSSSTGPVWKAGASSRPMIPERAGFEYFYERDIIQGDK